MGVANDVSGASDKFNLANVFWWVPGLSNLISTRHNNQTQIQLQEEAQNWNKEQADIAWQRGLEQWNRENEYNSPLAQMQRLREAGINPALAYSSGIANQAGTSPSAPVPAPARAAPTQAFQMDPLTFANVGLIDAQREKLETESDVLASKLPEELQNMRQQRKESDARISELNQTVVNLQEQVKNLSEERKLTIQRTVSEEFNRGLAAKEFERKSKETVAIIKELASRVSVNEADVALKRSVTKLNWQEYDYYMKANPLRLVGLDLDNKFKQSEIRINQLNSILLGFDVRAGQLKFKQDTINLRNYNGDRGRVRGLISRGLNNLMWSTDRVFGSVGNLIH